jgi:acyl-CoA synthetase (AMP-forming)/AMP-acid ligase II
MSNAFNSKLPQREIPAISVTDYVLRHASRLADHPALIDGSDGHTLTYAQLNDGIRRLAGGLAARGFGKGDVFAIYSPNIPEYAVIFHGVTLAGGTVTTINPTYTPQELVHQLNDASARYIFTVPAALPTVLQVQADTQLEEVFVLGDQQDLSATSLSELYGESMSDDAAPTLTLDDDIAVLPYSSGTTGLSKGVMLTHYNLVANLVQLEQLELQEGQSVVAALPFFHIYGMQLLMNSMLAAGGTVVTMQRFDLELFLSLHQRYKIPQAYVVPPMLLALARAPVVDDYDLSALTKIFCAAAPLGIELESEAAARLNCLVVQGYGLTETSPVTHLPIPGVALPAGSIGVALSNIQCRVVDPESGSDLGPEERGELWIRGPNVMKGYLGAPDATAATIDDDGWLRTGDIVTVDSQGYFFVVDRLKELIKYKGYQVAPAELEGLLLTHPAVADAAVVPLPDDEAGEVPKAFVVLKSDTDTITVTPQSLMEFVASEVSHYKHIRQVEFIDAIPKSPSGKILRRLLRDREPMWKP